MQVYVHRPFRYPVPKIPLACIVRFIYIYIYRGLMGFIGLRRLMGFAGFQKPNHIRLRTKTLYFINAMEDFLDLLTYDCPFTGRKRCAADPYEKLECKYPRSPSCNLLLHFSSSQCHLRRLPAQPPKKLPQDRRC